MDIQEIEVEIDGQGLVSLHVKGISGNACLSMTRDLEAVLGDVILNRQMTPEADPTEGVARVDPVRRGRITH